MSILDTDDIALVGILRDHLDPEAFPELAEFERRFWRHKIGEYAAQQGMSLAQFFQMRINEAD